MQTNIHCQFSVINCIVGNLYLADILDAILNILQCSMMAGVHYFDSIMTVSYPEEAKICIPYKYIVNHLKSLKQILFWQPSWMPLLVFKQERHSS